MLNCYIPPQYIEERDVCHEYVITGNTNNDLPAFTFNTSKNYKDVKILNSESYNNDITELKSNECDNNFLKTDVTEIIVNDISEKYINVEITSQYTSNKNTILLDLDKMLIDEKKNNNIKPNKLSLDQIKKFISSYYGDFKFLPRTLLYPQTKDVGLAWGPKKDCYINLFFLKDKYILYLIDYTDTNTSKKFVVTNNEENFKEAINLIEKELDNIKV